MNIKEEIYDLGKNAKIASQEMGSLNNKNKNLALENLIKNIENYSDKIIQENKKDLAIAEKK